MSPEEHYAAHIARSGAKWREVPHAHAHYTDRTFVMAIPHGALVLVVSDESGEDENGGKPMATGGLVYVPSATLAHFGMETGEGQ